MNYRWSKKSYGQKTLKLNPDRFDVDDHTEIIQRCLCDCAMDITQRRQQNSLNATVGIEK